MCLLGASKNNDFMLLFTFAEISLEIPIVKNAHIVE